MGSQSKKVKKDKHTRKRRVIHGVPKSMAIVNRNKRRVIHGVPKVIDVLDRNCCEARSRTIDTTRLCCLNGNCGNSNSRACFDSTWW